MRLEDLLRMGHDPSSCDPLRRLEDSRISDSSGWYGAGVRCADHGEPEGRLHGRPPSMLAVGVARPPTWQLTVVVLACAGAARLPAGDELEAVGVDRLGIAAVRGVDRVVGPC